MRLIALSLSLALAATVAPGQGLAYTMEIANQTGHAITAFWGSHIDAPSWEAEIFKGGQLPSGESVEIDFTDGTGYCVYDIRAEFDDGAIAEKFDVNVCATTTFTFE